MSNINLSVYKDAGFSTSQLRALESFLEKNPLHWIQLNPETGIYELILDNHMLSMYRSCPAHFMLQCVDGWAGKGRSWFLDFGILFHRMIELYYTDFRKLGFNVNDWFMQTAIKEWNEANLGIHSSHKECVSMNGVMGFVALLIAYSNRFSAENERIRIIGTEISFGKNKEVPLGALLDNFNLSEWLQCYLSGRIDVLVDDGTSIAPMDHKTMGSMRYDPTLRFELDEGPTGYVFAVNAILPKLLESQGLGPALLNRNCNKIIMNFISKSIPKEGDRFKRLPIHKTTEQLESYRLRMLATYEAIFRDLIKYISTGVVYRDTSKCTNWFMSDCSYLSVHRQNTKANELAVLNQFFEKKEVWNTEEV